MQKDGYVFANIPDVNMNYFNGNLPNMQQMTNMQTDTKDPAKEEQRNLRTSSLLKRAFGGTVVEQVGMFDKAAKYKKKSSSNYGS